MKLTWRDGATALLAAAVIGVYYAITRGVDIPLISTNTGAMVAVGLLAVAMGLVGMERRDVEEGGWLVTLILLGVVTLGLFVASFFAMSQTMLLLVTIGVIAMWAVGFAHHLVSESGDVGAPV